MPTNEQTIYSESKLLLLINSIIPIAILLITLFLGLYSGVFIYLVVQFLVLYFVGLCKIKQQYIEIWYLFRKPKRIQFEEISKIEFRQVPKSGTQLILVFKNTKRVRSIDEDYRPALLAIINHLNSKGVRIQRNEHWPRTFDFKNGVYYINEHLK